MSTGQDTTWDIEVRVSGPGGVIADEMQLIRELLIECGYRVNVQDEHPWPDVADIRSKRTGKGKIVKLVAVHCPWGRLSHDH